MRKARDPSEREPRCILEEKQNHSISSEFSTINTHDRFLPRIEGRFPHQAPSRVCRSHDFARVVVRL